MYRLEITHCTQTLLAEIAMPEATRDSVGVTYELALASSEATDWPTVNRAIMERWSRSGLEYVKRVAWKS